MSDNTKIEWHHFRNVWLRLASVNLIGDPFYDTKEKAAAVRINIGGADSRFICRPHPFEKVHDAMVTISNDVAALRDACGMPDSASDEGA